MIRICRYRYRAWSIAPWLVQMLGSISHSVSLGPFSYLSIVLVNIVFKSAIKLSLPGSAIVFLIYETSTAAPEPVMPTIQILALVSRHLPPLPLVPNKLTDIHSCDFYSQASFNFFLEKASSTNLLASR